MRRIVVAVLAALVGFGLFFFWFGGRAPTPEPVQVTAPETLPTETAPADTAGAVAAPPAEPAADAPVPPHGWPRGGRSGDGGARGRGAGGR